MSTRALVLYGQSWGAIDQLSSGPTAAVRSLDRHGSTSVRSAFGQLFSGLAAGRIQTDVHATTADAVVNLPLRLGKFSPYVLGGGGALAFRPTENAGGFVPGASTQTQGAFLYGVGADYPLSHRLALRAEYRGLVYKAPDFSLPSLNSESWTHTAQPSAGIVLRF